MIRWFAVVSCAAVALVFAGCGGSDGCDGDGCGSSLAAQCEAVCNRTGSCLEELGLRLVTQEEIDSCVGKCTDVWQGASLATCDACTRSVECPLVERCIDSNICETPRHDLEAVASGFEAWEGADVYVAVMEIDEGRYYSQEHVAVATIASGGFRVTIPQAFWAGEPSALDVFVDSDGNGTCDPADFAFRHELPVVRGAVSVRLTPPAERFDEACDPYGWWAETRLFVEGSGFSGHEGRWVILSWFYESLPAHGREYQIARVENGRFRARFDWPSSDGRIVWMIDDGDWTCTQRDLGGYVSFDGADGDAVISIDSGSAAPGFCADLPAFTAKMAMR